MLHDLDETIKLLLRQAGGFGRDGSLSNVDISFVIPNREWSEKLGNRPTINCYLFDIHERRVLREEGWQLEGPKESRRERRSPPLFFEISYVITVWTLDVEDEHRLLWSVLETLMDYPLLPQELCQGVLKQHPWPLQTNVAQAEGVLKSPGEFWTALENQIKPSLSYSVTLGRDRKARPAGPPIQPGGVDLDLSNTTVSSTKR